MGKAGLEETRIHVRGRQLGIGSAIIGSLVFALVDLASAYVKSYIIDKTDSAWSAEDALFIAGWISAVILLGSALAYLPARLLGDLLGRWLDNDSNKRRLTARGALAKGGLVGAMAGVAICLPILLLEVRFVSPMRQGALPAFIYRSVEATIIASLAGAWTGLQIQKILASRSSPTNRAAAKGYPAEEGIEPATE